jgi:hypothetical protein
MHSRVFACVIDRCNLSPAGETAREHLLVSLKSPEVDMAPSARIVGAEFVSGKDCAELSMPMA